MFARSINFVGSWAEMHESSINEGPLHDVCYIRASRLG